ncbi:unnamed protein product [Prorocentrum cordatum]|uniref:Uncharacterized protein n=1 Tax=Prorocentrum cordatum TaxID=2364126 RepID=A0ABN9UT10_9DINO|nr:unnamed protein product [Polarella glacialis]
MAAGQAALWGGVAGCLMPLACAGGIARCCGCAPDHRTGSGHEIPRQPVGLVGVFGAVIASSAAAVGALAASTVAAGVAVGVVAAVGVTGLACGGRRIQRTLPFATIQSGIVAPVCIHVLFGRRRPSSKGLLRSAVLGRRPLLPTFFVSRAPPPRGFDKKT